MRNTIINRRILAFSCALVLLITCLTACTPIAKVDDVSLLEFPGIKWGATPEEVKAALELTDKQIIADEQQITGEGSYQEEYETWNLFVSGLSFLGTKTVGAHFMFIRYPGHEFGLTRIQLYLPDDADMGETKADMVKIYGEGSAKPSPNYSFRDGKLVATEIDKTNAGNAYLHYWFSTVKGTDVLTAEVQERYVEYATSRNSTITRESALEYLEKEPLVTVSCATKNIMATLNEKSETPNQYITQNTVIFAANQLIHNLQKYDN